MRNRQRRCLPASTAWTTLSHFTLQLKLRKMRGDARDVWASAADNFLKLFKRSLIFAVNN